MKRQPVVSSNLASIGYDAATSTLEVEFRQGGLYRYSGVPGTVHAELMAADSHGKYFDINVKKAGYPYQRIG